MADEKKIKKLKRLMSLEQDPTATVFNELERIDSTIEDIKSQVDNIELKKGDQGDPGKDGKDYVLTEQDKQQIASSIKVPIVEKVIEKTTEVIKEPTVVQNITQVVDKSTIIQDSAQKVLETIVIPEETGETIVNKINDLPTNDQALKIDAKHIKNLPTAIQQFGGVTPQKVLDLIAENPSASTFLDLTDTPDDYTGQGGKAVYVKGDESGLQFQAAVSSDEKVKYDAADPTAGYVADKFVAGTGITLSEGTGADENKLKITNSLDLSGYVPYTGATGDVNLGTHEILTSALHANSSAGVHIHNSSGGDIALFGAGGGLNSTFYDGVKLDAQTASRILSTDSSKNITALDTATYPDLTELSYVKGVTSAIQTQLDSKLSTTTASTTYAKLDGTNQPFTGDLNISKATPEHRLTDTTSSRYARLVRGATNNALTVYNQVEQPASLKYALNFSGGNNGYVTMGTAAALKLTGALSYAVWIKGNGSNNYGGIMGRGSGATAIAGAVASMLYFHSTTGNLRFDLSNGTSQLNLVTATGNYDDNAWHFVVVTWDGSTTANKVKIYVDNVEVAAGTAPGTTITTNPSRDNFFKVGKMYVDGNLYSFNGIIDAPVVFSRELTAGERTTMWNGGLGLRPSTAVAPYNDANFVEGWNFDEGSGTIAGPVKVGGVSGTLTSSPTWVAGFSFPTTYTELPAITVKDGVNTGEGGAITIGDSAKTPGVVLDGQTVKLNIGGTTKATLDSSGDLTLVGRLLAQNGTATLPAISASSDPNTGMYWSGADDLLFATAGTVRMSFNNIGTAAFIPNGTQTLNISSTGVGIGGLYSGYSGQFNVQNTSSATTKITSVIKAIASQTSDLTQWQNSAGANIARIAANGKLTINSNATPFLAGDDSGLAHGMTSLLPTDQFFGVEEYRANNGGVVIRGLTGATNDDPVITLAGTSGRAAPAVAPIRLSAQKKSGTGAATLAAGEPAVSLYNYTSHIATFYGNSSGVIDGGLTINETGADQDTRIEGDTVASLFFVDASTDRIGIGSNSPTTRLDVYDSGANIPAFALRDGDISLTPLTDINPNTTADTVARWSGAGSTQGGAFLGGFSNGTISGLYFEGVMNTTTPTAGMSAVTIRGAKRSGTVRAVLADTDTVLSIRNFSATNSLVNILGNGKTGFLTTNPEKQVEINSVDGNNLRLTYNDSDGSAANYVDFLTTSTGDLTITPSGGDISLGSAVLTTTGSIDAGASIEANAYTVGGVAGASGSFTTVDLKTVTVVNGIITSIV